jgi:hypothetical protein
MGVKADKTFEDVVERLAALFKLKPRPGEHDYEEHLDRELPKPLPSAAHSALRPKHSSPRSRKKKRSTKSK